MKHNIMLNIVLKIQHLFKYQLIDISLFIYKDNVLMFK